MKGVSPCPWNLNPIFCIQNHFGLWTIPQLSPRSLQTWSSTCAVTRGSLYHRLLSFPCAVSSPLCHPCCATRDSPSYHQGYFPANAMSPGLFMHDTAVAWPCLLPPTFWSVPSPRLAQPHPSFPSLSMPTTLKSSQALLPATPSKPVFLRICPEPPCLLPLRSLSRQVCYPVP